MTFIYGTKRWYPWFFVISIYLFPGVLHGQPNCEQKAKTITLQTPEPLPLPSTCNPQKYTARDYVEMLPGFEYIPAAGESFLAQVDNTLIFPIEYLSGSDIPDADNHTPNTSLPVGTTPGVAGVSPTGAATYQIPIHIPPGTAGMQPNISLVYNSQAGNGQLGWGWNIAGLSAITRVPQTIYHDGTTGGVNLNSNDRFALDGNRLIVTNGGTYGANGTQYRTEVETFNLVTSFGVEGTGPQRFEVKTKDGLIMEFGGSADGSSADSRFMAGTGTVILWRINKITDQSDNFIEFVYENENNESRIEEIRYTRNDVAGLQPYNIIKFYYASRNDGNVQWIAGVNAEARSNILLRMIRVEAENNLVKEYELKYSKNHTDDIYSFLTEIVEFSSDHSRLNSTVFEYPQPATFTQNTLSFIAGNADKIPVDFDGDGEMDLILAHYITDPNGFKTYLVWQMYNASGQLIESDLFPPNTRAISTGRKNFIGHSLINSSDFTGDGLDDIFVLTFVSYNSTLNLFTMNLTVLESTGTNLITGYTETGFIISSQIPLVGDFNGDGVKDIALFSHYTDQAGNAVNRAFIIDAYNQTFNIIDLPEVFDTDVKFIVDFNGDGKDDILATKDFIAMIISFNAALTSFSQLYAGVSLVIKDTIYPGDFNGDGKTDILTYNYQNGWNISYSTGIEFNQIPFPFSLSVSNYNLTIGDFNGDGKSDIFYSHTVIDNSAWVTFLISIINFFINYPYLYFSSEITADIGNNISQTADVYYSNGMQWHKKNYLNSNFTGITHHFFKPANSVEHLIINFSNQFLPKDAIAGDFNGDSKGDVIHLFPNRGYELYLFNPQGKDHLLAKIANGMNHKTEFTYLPLTDNAIYTKGTGASFPVNDFQGSLHVVSSATIPDGLGGVSITNHSYEGAIIHKQGKGFTGFSKMIASNTTNNRKIISTNELNPTFVDMRPIKQEVQTTGGIPLSTTDYVNDEFAYGNKRYFPFVDNMTSENFLPGSGSNIIFQDFTYDDNDPNTEEGNLTDLVTEQRDGNNNLIASTTTNTDYTTFPGWWIHSRPDLTTVTQSRPLEDNFVTVTDYGNYNDKGQLLDVTADASPTGGKSVTTTYEYNNPFGNLSKTTTSATGLDDRFETIEFDEKGRFITKRTNALGHFATAEFEPAFGNMTKQTDATGLLTSNEYDAFGRLKKTITPEGNAITVSMDWAGGTPANAVFFTQTIAPGVPGVKSFHGLLGRELLTETDGFSGTVSVGRTYNARGELTSVTYPRYASDPVKTISYTYNNDFGYRQTENNNGQITNYSISGTTTTVTNPAGQSFTRTIDAAGALTSATDAGGAVNYSYFSHGQPKEVTSAGVTTEMEYDEYARQAKLTDPNAGETVYDYNAFGELILQTDANGNTYNNMQYDRLGRIISKTETDGTSGTVVGDYSYFYVTTGNGLGNLQIATAPNGNTTAYEYDPFSRPSKITENIDGQNFDNQYEYDNFGNLIKTTYPSGYMVENNYDGNGYLTEVTDPQEQIFQTISMNARDQYTQYHLGNDRLVFHTHNEYGRITHKATCGSGQFLEWDWDNSSGNIISLTDNSAVSQCFSFEQLTEDDPPDLFESFTYDNLNRNIGYTVAGQSGLNINYAPNGNIVNKTDAGTYTYNPNKPHAVQTVTDPLGLMPLTQNITYTPFKRPEIVTEGDYELTFSYGPEQQRKKTVLKNNSIVQRTITYSGNYEKIEIGSDVYEVHYITSPAGLIAINVRQNGGADNLFYVYTDHLGSILTLTDNTGAVVYEQNFDPWGRERNPNTWNYTANPNTKPPWLIRGFTGHEHNDEVGLINMNARLYDPIVARMLSPDNFVQDATGTQGYNRYSYVVNNPLVYADLDGEFIQYVIGAIIGGISGYKIADAYGYTGWDKFWYTLGGAAIGAVTAGVGTAVSSSAGVVAGGVVGGAVGGAGFGTMSGYAAGLRGGDLFSAGITGLFQGAVTGLAGSVVGGAIGGGWGALAGGATAGGVGTLMSGGSGEDILMGAALGGAMGLGLYHASLLYSYKVANIKETMGLNYNRYAKMLATTQRSIFWNREGKFIPNSRGGINVNKLGGVGHVGATEADYNDALFDYHTHKDWGSTLADGEGFSTYASGGIKSDEFARSQLNTRVQFKGPMYLGTREGHIWYMNSNFSRGMLPYNFSPVFTPFNMAWSLSLIR